ncbi:MAG: hypothetical protein JWM52_314 [Candidatus Saccharibacteria bacterium]|nr:hypothetical protein [Candidatus Saccharibacteria bacterium]
MKPTTFTKLPDVPTFTVTSADISHDEHLGLPHLSGIFGIKGGEDKSPQLSWSGAPEGTKSYIVTVYDPDAPTQAGFWHWAVANIPADVNELVSGAGTEAGDLLPHGAVQLPNDARMARFIGGAPPAGTGAHRYVFVVYALDVDRIDVPAGSTPTFLEFNALSHIIGKAVIIPFAETVA